MSESKMSLFTGAFAGFCSLSVLVPLDLLKCRAQSTKEGKLDIPKEARTVFSEQGLKGFYRGFWASAWRDVPSTAVYFSSYVFLKGYGEKMIDSWDLSPEKKQRAHVTWILNAGGCAGVISWALSIPQDIIKTKQQCHMGEHPLSIKEAYQQLMREGGVRRIFNGAAPMLTRGYVKHMVTLPVYDLIVSRLKRE